MERLVQIIRTRLAYCQDKTTIRDALISSYSEEEIFLAYVAAKRLNLPIDPDAT